MNKPSCRKMSLALRKAKLKIEEASAFMKSGSSKKGRKMLHEAFSQALKAKMLIGAGKFRWKIADIVSELSLLSMNDGVTESDLSAVRRDIVRLTGKAKLC